MHGLPVIQPSLDDQKVNGNNNFFIGAYKVDHNNGKIVINGLNNVDFISLIDRFDNIPVSESFFTTKDWTQKKPIWVNDFIFYKIRRYVFFNSRKQLCSVYLNFLNVNDNILSIFPDAAQFCYWATNNIKSIFGQMFEDVMNLLNWKDISDLLRLSASFVETKGIKNGVYMKFSCKVNDAVRLNSLFKLVVLLKALVDYFNANKYLPVITEWFGKILFGANSIVTLSSWMKDKNNRGGNNDDEATDDSGGYISRDFPNRYVWSGMPVISDKELVMWPNVRKQKDIIDIRFVFKNVYNVVLQEGKYWISRLINKETNCWSDTVFIHCEKNMNYLLGQVSYAGNHYYLNSVKDRTTYERERAARINQTSLNNNNDSNMINNNNFINNNNSNMMNNNNIINNNNNNFINNNDSNAINNGSFINPSNENNNGSFINSSIANNPLNANNNGLFINPSNANNNGSCINPLNANNVNANNNGSFSNPSIANNVNANNPLIANNSFRTDNQVSAINNGIHDSVKSSHVFNGNGNLTNVSNISKNASNQSNTLVIQIMY